MADRRVPFGGREARRGRRRLHLYLAVAAPVLLAACGTTGTKHMRPEVHGHRGCRGLLPENTVPAFLKATTLGCDMLEMDVVITGDGQVLVSHEPWMEHRICLTPEGDTIPQASERDYNIHRMTLAQAQAFDCGRLHHPDHPDQQNLPAHKPTLREVVEAVDELSMELGLGNIGFNIEIKSDPEQYGTFQPEPGTFAALVLAQIDSLDLDGRCVLQSFDPAALEAVHALEPDQPVALLVENHDGVAANLGRLTFTPTYYSPSFDLMDAAAMRQLKDRDIPVLVWTVNEVSDMRRMMALGVRGIITDRPDRLIEVLDKEG